MALVARHQVVSLARVDFCLENQEMLMNEQLLILAARHPNGKVFHRTSIGGFIAHPAGLYRVYS
jgi:hypothetical protein